MTHWVHRWVGLPYAVGGRGPEAYDCLGLVLAVMADRRGLVMPDPLTDTPDHYVARSRLAAEWKSVPREAVLEGDVLLFPGEGGGRLHVGYALDARDMLHSSRQALGATVEDWTRPAWSHRLTGIFRHDD